MAGAVGAGQAAGHLGAEDRIHGNTKTAGHGRHVEAGVVEHLLDASGFHQLLEQRSLGLAAGNANTAHAVLVVADLNQAEAVAAVDQTHGFGVHRQSLCIFVMREPLRTEIPVKDSEVGG